jgi:hypothetical protein
VQDQILALPEVAAEVAATVHVTAAGCRTVPPLPREASITHCLGGRSATFKRLEMPGEKRS